MQTQILAGAFLLATACHSASGPSGPITNVKVTVAGKSVQIEFDDVDNARDYRVYAAPATGAPAPGTSIPNAIYRCAGDREGQRVPTDNEPQVSSGAVTTYVNHAVQGFNRTTADATLGYVYMTSGDGRVPVYSLGDPGPDADNLCFIHRWNASRVKTFTTSDSQRSTLLSQGWRDDGIAFYAPADGTSGTTQIQTAVVSGATLYFANGSAEARARSGATNAFSALTAQAAGTAPLMRVYYNNGCGRSHDELVAGNARFQKAVHQGSTPIPALTWSGLTGPTTLVIEALDQGCPFQGHLSPQAFPAWSTTGSDGINHQPYVTLSQLRANGEVYINGQHDPGNHPNVIAQSVVQVAPAQLADFDFHDDFSSGSSPGALTVLHDPTVQFQDIHYDAANYDISFYSIEQPQFGFGSMMGELWVTYADWAADTNGKFRITPKLKPTLAPDSFVHATMQVDMVTTSRRYPQLWISTLAAPIQPNLPNGASVLVQTFDEWPPRIDIEICDHRTWDVNNQCPRFPVQPVLGDGNKLPPRYEVGERTGVDRRAQFDVYASTSRVYVLLDGQPWACANLPASLMPAGPVTVTYGDVLYHSGVDVTDPPYTFHRAHMFTETTRHFTELGFKSGVAAPSWDEGRLPCVSNAQ
jgi:hypothetical protein